MKNLRHFSRCWMVFILFSLCILLPATVVAASDEASPDPTRSPGLEPILDYIAKSWDTLTRSMDECTTVVDPKLAENSVLYLPAEMSVPRFRMSRASA